MKTDQLSQAHAGALLWVIAVIGLALATIAFF